MAHQVWRRNSTRAILSAAASLPQQITGQVRHFYPITLLYRATGRPGSPWLARSPPYKTRRLAIAPKGGPSAHAQICPTAVITRAPIISSQARFSSSLPLEKSARLPALLLYALVCFQPSSLRRQARQQAQHYLLLGWQQTRKKSVPVRQCQAAAAPVSAIGCSVTLQLCRSEDDAASVSLLDQGVQLLLSLQME